MIEKGNNIHKHPQLKRIVEHNGEQINFLDQRFYKTETGEYYPSVTSILNFYPKNGFFHAWLKDVGHNSDIIARKAADEGTQVHNAIESFLEGKEIKWMDDKGFNDINSFRGKLSVSNTTSPGAYERVQFMKHFSGIE